MNKSGLPYEAIHAQAFPWNAAGAMDACHAHLSESPYGRFLDIAASDLELRNLAIALALHQAVPVLVSLAVRVQQSLG
jgi:hypothetical protein